MHLIKLFSLGLIVLSLSNNFCNSMQFYVNGNLYGSIPARNIQQNIVRNVLLMSNEIVADLINMFGNNENDIIEDNERNINTFKTQLKEIKNNLSNFNNINKQSTIENFYSLISNPENLDYVIENKDLNVFLDVYDILFEISTIGNKYMPYNTSRFKSTLPVIQEQFINGTNYEIDLTRPIESIKNGFVDYYIKMVNLEYNKICKPVKQNADNNIKKIDNFTKNNKSSDNTETDKCIKILNILKDFFKENNNYIDKFVTKDFTINTLFSKTWRNQIKESNIEELINKFYDLINNNSTSTNEIYEAFFHNIFLDRYNFTKVLQIIDNKLLNKLILMLEMDKVKKCNIYDKANSIFKKELNVLNSLKNQEEYTKKISDHYSFIIKGMDKFIDNFCSSSINYLINNKNKIHSKMCHILLNYFRNLEISWYCMMSHYKTITIGENNSIVPITFWKNSSCNN